MSETFRRGLVTLVWPEDHELHGLKVVMRRRPFADVIEEIESESAENWNDLTPRERAERSRGNAATLGGLIVSWNLADDDGNLVELPPLSWNWSPDAIAKAKNDRADVLIRHCDQQMIADMRDAYMAGTSRISVPLEPSSAPGPAGASPSRPGEPPAPDMPEEWGPAAQVTTRPMDHPV